MEIFQQKVKLHFEIKVIFHLVLTLSFQIWKRFESLRIFFLHLKDKGSEEVKSKQCLHMERSINFLKLVHLFSAIHPLFKGILHFSHPELQLQNFNLAPQSSSPHSSMF